MAETALTVTTVGKAGTAKTTANADTSNGNKFANDGRTFLYLFNNGSTGSATVTIATAKTVGGYAVGNQDISLTTTQEKIAGPFDPDIFNDADGNVTLSISGAGATDVDFMAFK